VATIASEDTTIERSGTSRKVVIKVKIAIIILVVILCAVLAAGLFAGSKLYDIALNPGSDKSAVFGSIQSSNEVSGTTGESKADIDAWWAQSGYQEEYLQSSDGLKLHAYALRQSEPGSRWVISVHGYMGYADQMVSFARQFYEQGYSVLMPNLRGHGKSEGGYIGMGWHDRLDIKAWIGRILETEPEAGIALFGVSMGGAAVMMTSGEELPGNVFAVVEDCGYTSAWDEFSFQMKALFGLPSFPLMNFASLITRVNAGYFLEEASAVSQLKKTKMPVLFIHGEDDSFVPFSMLNHVYEAAAGEKEMYSVPGAKHGQAAMIAGDEYWARVFDFLTRHWEVQY